ncbi:THAP domain-containing protein 1-like [Photinus pyralis]|uniref:THAP domain-containing protein 1-like n=1 Tax=Photinus pyralis TaxID=7054 RepID=UPI0012673B3D|nr:THAP domain-containing protein 1-like [Photinus pyralis]
MVKHCCAYGCSNEWNPNLNIPFHTFPLKRPEILRLWVQAVRLVGFKPTATTVICGKHFTPDSYLESALNKNLLKKDAVPSIFNFPRHLMKTMTARREIIRHVNKDCSSDCTMDVDEFLNTNDKNTQTSPRKLKRSLVEQRMSRKIKILQQRLRRRESSIKNMKDLINLLRSNKKSDGDLEDTLSRNFSNFALELFKCEAGNKKVAPTQRRYTEEMKAFALTLYFYSPKAYQFVRSKIFLPHCSVMRKWLSSRNCEVGLLSEVFEFLAREAQHKSSNI